jgi:hypothetical protein
MRRVRHENYVHGVLAGIVFLVVALLMPLLVRRLIGSAPRRRSRPLTSNAIGWIGGGIGMLNPSDPLGRGDGHQDATDDTATDSGHPHPKD